MEGNHIVVAVDGEVRLPVQCYHDFDNDDDDHDDDHDDDDHDTII